MELQIDRTGKQKPDATAVTTTLSTVVKIVPRDQPVMDESVNPALRDAIRQSIKIESLQCVGDNARLKLFFDRPPMTVNFKIFARMPDGRAAEIGTGFREAGKQLIIDNPLTSIAKHSETSGFSKSTFGLGSTPNETPVIEQNPATLDLLFKVDHDASKCRIGPDPLWGEDVLITAVPVRPPSEDAAENLGKNWVDSR